jgi:hypothetical protein
MVGERIEKCNIFIMILLEDKVTGENISIATSSNINTTCNTTWVHPSLNSFS